MSTKQRKLIFTLLIIYTGLILFFLFFSFGRFNGVAVNQQYRFDLMPRNIHLRFPTISRLRNFQGWFFNFGNFAGFIPFGVLIPLLYPCKFFRFISLFFLSILIIETIQMVTFLGSFDINDAIVNILGAAVGFCGYKIGFHFTNIRKRFTFTLISIFILSIAVIGSSELMNKFMVKVEGPGTALDQMAVEGSQPLEKDMPSLEIAGEKIEPKINLYSSQGDRPEVFTYSFSGKDIVLILNYGVTDNTSDYESKMVILADGEVVDTYFIDKEHRYPNAISSEIYLGKLDELTITITGNVKVWDVTFKEMKYWWNRS